MMLKVIISFLIIYICTYLGVCKAKTYEIRERELKRIKNSLAFFKSKIEFTYEPIEEVFKSISKSVYLHKDNVFLKTTEFLNELDLNTSWNRAVEEAIYFNKEDKEILKMFGKLLGKTDKKGQISEVEITQEFIEKQIEKAQSEREKNAKLYQSLGIICGIGIVIILI